MTLPESLTQFLHENSDLIVVVLAAVTLLCVMGLLLLFARLARLNRLYRRLTKGTSGGNLEEVLHGYMGTVEEVAGASQSIREQIATLAERQRTCLNRVGVVRFDAFEEVGGEQSFAVVVLDSERNGLALSSVYSRSDVRVYAKHIRGGQPSHPLTREEEQALAQAASAGKPAANAAGSSVG
jgi:hypothetical protein